MGQRIKSVAIVGAGPVGLLGALELAKLGISVDVFDLLEGVDRRPRAAGYGPSAVRTHQGSWDVPEFSIGFARRVWSFATIAGGSPSGEYIAGIKDVFNPNRDDRYVTMPVDQLTQIIYEALQKYPTAKVHWKHRFTGFVQDEEKVVISTEHAGQTTSFTADFVLGCDGGRSGVRRALFGRNFPGHTWDVQIVATNLYFPDDRMEKLGWSDISWVIDPDHWAVICKIETNPDIWRVSYGEPGHLTEEELRARCPEKLATLLPGAPGPGDYELGRFSPYKLHQRCVPKMRVGRVLLAGDAAHLCNPMGGLGLTGGIADIGCLVDCLQAIHEGLASMSILDKYDQQRRQKYHTVTDVVSTTNLKRLFLPGEDALLLDPVLQRIEQASRHLTTAKELFEASDNLTVDMSQFYDLQPKGVNGIAATV